MLKTMPLLSGLAIVGLLAGCSHTVRVGTPKVTSLNAQVPFAVDVVISAQIHSAVVHPSTYSGAIKHTFDVPVGEPLTDTLQRVAHAAFREATIVPAPTGDRPILDLDLSGSPVVNIQWQQGLFLVGQRTDCHMAVQARLLSKTGEQVWQTVVAGDAQQETGRIANWPTAAQAEPAVRQAIEALGAELLQRLTTAREIAAYSPRSNPRARSATGTGMGVTGTEEAAPRPRAGSATTDAGQRLRELDQLRKDGLITDSEYRAKREGILQGL
jgi:hypothetical protein